MAMLNQAITVSSPNNDIMIESKQIELASIIYLRVQN